MHVAPLFEPIRSPEGEAPSARPPRRRAVARAILLVAGFALLLSVQLGAAPVSSRAERRCDDIVSGMHASGEWLVPRRDGAAWLNKPPLFYWLASSVASLRGRADRAGLRSVSVFAALGTLTLILLWARRRGANEGLLAGALFTAMVEVLARGREGTAEMTLCFLATLCLFLFVEREFSTGESRGHVSLRWVFAAVLGAALLTKATSALLVVGLPISVSLLSRGRGAQLLSRRVLVPVGAAVLLGVSWYAIVSLTTPGAFTTFTSALLLPLGIVTEAQSELRSATHYGAWYLPIDSLVRGAAPVSLLLPLVIARGWRSGFWRPHPALRFHAIVVLSLLAAFLVLPQKRPHYLLPCLPSLALLSADASLATARRARSFARRMRAGLGLVQLVLLVLGGVGALFWFVVVLDVQGRERIVLVSALTLAFVAVFGTIRSRRTARVGAVALLLWWALLAMHAGSVQVWRERARSGAIAAARDAESLRWEQLLQDYPRLLGAFRPDRGAFAVPLQRDTGPSPTREMAADSFMHSLPVETPP